MEDVVTLHSPAKINVSLAITGRRADGFHELVSVVAPLELGDTLRAERRPDGAGFSLACDAPGVPADGSNLVLRAARAFADETGWRGGAHFVLEKRIPVGAGLGGGSGNAVAALRALEWLSGVALGDERGEALASGLGSDCPLFWRGGPVVMRGRGERLAGLPVGAAGRLRGRRVLVFKPAFGVETAWAYRALAGMPGAYVEAAAEEARIAAWMADGNAPAERLALNTMEGPVFAKWPALPGMLELIEERHGLRGRMSGSGSACFVFLPEAFEAAPVLATVREGWGESAFVAETRLA